MTGPKYTIKLSRKDKAPIKFTDHKGSVVENRFQPIGAMFENQFGGFNVAIDKNGPLGKFADEFYVNVYANDKDREGGRSTASFVEDEDSDLDF